MSNKKILYVSSEMLPYSDESAIAKIGFETVKQINSKVGQVRIFMPRYGNINERRHQLHEVIRLSGMNMIINDIDMPLIIKVASIPKERIQVYFIDNDEYFKKKSSFFNEKGKLFADNDEQCIFYAKGVVETIRKLSWEPDVIHIQGWLGLLLPMYLKSLYKDDPIFSHTKIITSFLEEPFKGKLGKDLLSKVLFDGIDAEYTKELSESSCENLMKSALKYSDGVIAMKDIASFDIVKAAQKLKIKNKQVETLEEFQKDCALMVREML